MEICCALEVCAASVSTEELVDEAASAGLAQSWAASTSGLRESTQEAMDDASAAAQVAAQKAMLAAKRLQRQESRARSAYIHPSTVQSCQC
jgi:hypothetical protein